MYERCGWQKSLAKGTNNPPYMSWRYEEMYINNRMYFCSGTIHIILRRPFKLIQNCPTTSSPISILEVLPKLISECAIYGKSRENTRKRKPCELFLWCTLKVYENCSVPFGFIVISLTEAPIRAPEHQKGRIHWDFSDGRWKVAL